jgi:hypothetical protein
MVLLFSKVIGVFGWGMLGAGDGGRDILTISSLALLVHSFRQLAVKLSGNKTPVLWRQVGWTTLALAGGVILLVAAVVMWMSAVPVGRGLRPFDIPLGRRKRLSGINASARRSVHHACLPAWLSQRVGYLQRCCRLSYSYGRR